MTSLLNHIHLAYPEFIILATTVLALLTDIMLPKKGSMMSRIICQGGLIIAAFVSGLYINAPSTALLSAGFMSDTMAHIMKIFILLTVFLSLYYSQDYIEERGIQSSDYHVLAMFSTLGMMVLVSANSLLTIYLGLELLSLPLYAMTAIRRTETECAEAAMKYFVMGAMASGILLYGMSLLYGVTGALTFTEINAALTSAMAQSQSGLLIFSLVFIASGVCFKLAAAPFHMWAPDTYEGAPSCTTLFLSAAPKIAAMGMLLRFTQLDWGELMGSWQQILLLIALLSTAIGNILAVVQTQIKRLLAYSAVSHAGYALFGVLAGTVEGYSAGLYYMLIYGLMSVCAFGLIVLLSRDGIEITLIDDLKGLNQRKPWLAFMMLLTMFSMAGVPPLVGFLTKLWVLKALVDVGYVWAAVLGLIFAVVGAFYYLRVVKVMYFDAPATELKMSVPRVHQVLLSVNGLLLVYFGLFPSTLMAICASAFSS